MTGLRRYTIAVVLAGAARIAMLAQNATTPDTGLDHVIVMFNPLDAAIDEFERLTGVRPVRGGSPAPGIENALVSLGDGRYLEILSPAPPADGTVSRLPVSTTFRPAGWAIHSPDLAGLVNRLRTPDRKTSDPRPASRRRPDGTLLSWSTSNIIGEGLQLAPFFIHWDAGGAHPSVTSPTGCLLKAFVLTDPAPDELATLIRQAGVDVPVQKGETRNVAITLTCPRGEITFRR